MCLALRALLSLPRQKDNAFGPFPLHSNLSGSGFTKQAGQSKTIATLGVKSTVSRKKGIFRFAKINIQSTGTGQKNRKLDYI